MQDWLSATADLVGMAVIVLPASLLSSRGSSGLTMRVPLTHGGGSLFIKLTGSTAPLSSAINDLVAQSAEPNKLSMSSPSSCAVMSGLWSHAFTA